MLDPKSGVMIHFLGVMCHMSGVKFQVSHVRSGVLCHLLCQASCVTFHKTEKVKEKVTFPPLVMRHVSFVGFAVSGVRFRCPVSPIKYVTFQVSCVTCHMSRFMGHKSCLVFFLSHEDTKLCKICACADYSTCRLSRWVLVNFVQDQYWRCYH